MSEFRAVLVSTASTTYRSAFLFSNLATEELLPQDLRRLVSWGKAKTGGASPSPRHPAFAPGSAETPKPRCTPFGRVTPTPLRTWFCALCCFNAFANNPRPARDRDVFEATEPPRRVLPVAFTSPGPVHSADGAGRPAREGDGGGSCGALAASCAPRPPARWRRACPGGAARTPRRGGSRRQRTRDRLEGQTSHPHAPRSSW